jgi:hypothetical protein
MKTVRTKVYQFHELNEDAKQKAIEWFLSGNDYSTAWEDIEEDAKQIGLKIISLDGHRANEGEFMVSANEVAANIFREHGEMCETYKTAIKFMEQWEPVFANYMDENHPDYESSESGDKLMEMEDEFLHSLLEDYRIMYNENIDYENSELYAIEMIEANEYDFTKDGNRFHQ